MTRDEKIEAIKLYYAGFLWCPECAVFHFFPDEAQRLGRLPIDQAGYIPLHLTPEEKKEAMTFNIYRYRGWHCFINEKAMIQNYEWNNRHGEI